MFGLPMHKNVFAVTVHVIEKQKNKQFSEFTLFIWTLSRPFSIFYFVALAPTWNVSSFQRIFSWAVPTPGFYSQVAGNRLKSVMEFRISFSFQRWIYSKTPMGHCPAHQKFLWDIFIFHGTRFPRQYIKRKIIKILNVGCPLTAVMCSIWYLQEERKCENRSIDAIKEKKTWITIAFPIYSAVQCALLVVCLSIMSDKTEKFFSWCFW